MNDETYSWSGKFSDLDPSEQRVVAQLVAKGAAVNGTVEDLLVRLKRTRCVALLRKKGTNSIVGAAALKMPTALYRCNKFVAAGMPITGFEAAPELGYVVVALEMRGKQLSGDLVDLIVCQITEPTFATTGSETMRNNFQRSGFMRVGKDWKGEHGMLSLWTITPI